MKEKVLTTTEINAALESIDVCKKTALVIAFTVVEKIRQRNNNNADMRKADWISELQELEDKMLFYNQLGDNLCAVIENCSNTNLLPVVTADDIFKEVDKSLAETTQQDLHEKAEKTLEAKGIKRIGTKHGNIEDLP